MVPVQTDPFGRRLYDHSLCEEKHDTINRRIERMETILEEVRNRPTWIVLMIISALGTSCGALIMYILTGHVR